MIKTTADFAALLFMAMFSLIAIGAFVGAAFVTARRFGWRLQFSLRALLVATTVLAILLGILVVLLRTATMPE
jgi:hypothetical protein